MGWVIPYNGLYGEATPESVNFNFSGIKMKGQEFHKLKYMKG